jgi:glycosyltransferase involved in cell wall biosynthesis
MYVDELRKYCETIDFEVIKPRWQKLKSVPYLFSGRPLSIPYFYCRNLQKTLDQRLSEKKYEVIFTFSSPMAEYVLKSKAYESFMNVKGNGIDGRPKLIMDFVDVDSDKWRMYSEFSVFPKSWLFKAESRRLSAYEKKVSEIFDASLFVSDAEVRIFKSFANVENICCIPNGVDLDHFEKAKSKRMEYHAGNQNDNPKIQETINQSNTDTDLQEFKGLKILFAGAMDYFPNEDAVLYFYHSIWPLVQRGIQKSTFFIVGGNPSNKLRRLARQDSSVVVTGFVQDIRHYLWNADIFVAPLRIARGVQNKVLEALAAELPVVATTRAVQGLDCNGEDYLRIADSDSTFADNIIELSSKILDKESLENRKFFLKQKYNWRHNLSKLEYLLD